MVINTCSVREKAEDKLYTRLGDLKGLGRATGHAPIVAVAGCVAQQEGSRLLERSPLIDVVMGTQRVKMLPVLVEQARQRAPIGQPARASRPRRDRRHATPYDEPSFPLGLTRHADPVKAYVTIIEGCNDFCAFCVVPYTRGHERMRAKAEILADVRRGGRQRARRRSSSSDRSSITTRRPTIPPATLPGCSKRSTPSRACGASVLRARIRGMPPIG